MRVNGDNVFISSALAHQIIGLKQETELHWRARLFEVDLGTVEILPINDAFCTDSAVNTVNAIYAIYAKSGIRNPATVST